MDGATASLITGGAFLLLGTGIAHSWNRTNRIEKKQNRDHDCIIGLKKDTEYIREKMDAVIKVLIANPIQDVRRVVLPLRVRGIDLS